MGGKKETKPPSASEVRTAIQKLAKHKFHDRMKEVDGNEPHIVLPEIWPVIQELCTIADASEAGMLEVKG